MSSIFPDAFRWKWPDWGYRAKIGLGILEFFLDANTFNPNDEFSSDSLYLCSPIELSFGYTFLYEAKLLNYDDLHSVAEFGSLMANKRCSSDEDCVYTSSCKAKCDLDTLKCTSNLVEPQLVAFCRFLRDFLSDGNSTSTQSLEPIIKRCINDLKQIDELKKHEHSSKSIDMPFKFAEFKSYMAQKQYWNVSLNYATITNELQSRLWKWAKYLKDPVKRKKTSSSSSSSTATKSAQQQQQQVSPKTKKK